MIVVLAAGLLQAVAAVIVTAHPHWAIPLGVGSVMTIIVGTVLGGMEVGNRKRPKQRQTLSPGDRVGEESVGMRFAHNESVIAANNRVVGYDVGIDAYGNHRVTLEGNELEGPAETP